MVYHECSLIAQAEIHPCFRSRLTCKTESITGHTTKRERERGKKKGKVTVQMSTCAYPRYTCANSRARAFLLGISIYITLSLFFRGLRLAIPLAFPFSFYFSSPFPFFFYFFTFFFSFFFLLRFLFFLFFFLFLFFILFPSPLFIYPRPSFILQNLPVQR